MVTRLGLGEHAENGRAAGGYVRRSGSLAAWWWGLFLGAVGCSGASDAVQLPAEVGYSVTDSAGVRAVVNTAPLWGSGEGWRVTPEPLQTLGVVDTALAQQFHEIGEVTRLRDGTVVVLNHGTGELRAFDSSGRHRWNAGGRGEGPGELSSRQRQAHLSRLTGDTLLVGNGLERIRFGTDGELIDHQRVDFARLQELGRYDVGSCPGGRSYYADEIVVCRRNRLSPEPGHRWGTGSVTVARIPWPLDRVDTIGTFFRADLWEAEATLPHPLPPVSELWSSPLGPAGSLWIGGSHRPKLLYARNDAYRIEVWDLLDATLSMVVERRAPRRARTEAEVFVAVRWGMFPEPFRSGLSLNDDRWSVADSLSIAERFFLDDEGFLWVRRSPVGDDEGVRYEVPAPPLGDGFSGHVVWRSSGLHDVFRPDGAYLGTVKLPHDLNVREIGADYVLGVARDELGVEYVQLYGLDRGAPDTPAR